MNKSIKLVLYILISVTLLYFLFRGVDAIDLWVKITETKWPYILICIALMIGSVVVRAIRWQLLIDPIQRIPVNILFGSAMIGYFGNSVLPFRLGEMLKAYSVAKNSKITTSAAFGTVILERVLDMLGLSLMIVVCVGFLPLDSWIVNSIVWVFGLTLLAAVTVLGLGKYSSNLIRTIEKRSFFQSLIGSKILKFFDNLFEGVTVLKATRHVGLITFHTLFLWVIYYVYMGLIIWSMNIHLSWVAYGIVLIVTTLAISVPAAPGYWGTYHAAAIFVMNRVFNVSEMDSQAFAVISHAIGFFPFLLIGAFYFIKSSVHLSDITERESMS